MNCVIEKITPSLLATMKQTLSQSAGYDVSINDELEYFNEFPQTGWFVAKNFSSAPIGFVRHFIYEDWAQVELYVDNKISNRDIVAKGLLERFFNGNHFSGLRLRFDVPAQDIEMNQTIQKMGLSEKKQHFLFFEIGLIGKNDNPQFAETVLEKETLQVAEVISNLHPVSESQVKIWIENQELRCIRYKGKIVSVAHVSLSDKTLEIV